MADLYKSPLNTIKLLMRNKTIPYLIVEYTKNSMSALLFRSGVFMLADAELSNFEVSLGITPIPYEKLVDDIMVKATRLTIDHNIITRDTCRELLGSISKAEEVVLKNLTKASTNNERFTSVDFDNISRMAVILKHCEGAWDV